MTGNTWTELPDGAVDQSSPVTDVLLTALRDNPKGIAERAAGAPIVRIAQPEILTGSGTWTVPDGVTAFKVTVVGAGGAGGRGLGSPGVGGGGHCGTVAFKWYNNVSPGDSYSYSCGSGGTPAAGTGGSGGSTIFDSVTAYGGLGGLQNSTFRTVTANAPVGADFFAGSSQTLGSTGSSGMYGRGGNSGASKAGSEGSGLPGTGYGSGGGGGADQDSGGDLGGSGAPGVIIIEY